MDTVSLESIILALSYGGIFLLMISNGAVSFPSSQVLYILVGYFIGQGILSLPFALLAGAIGNTIGCIILYELARYRGRAFIERLKLFPPEHIRRVETAFKKKGVWFVFVGKLLPAIKVFVPIPAGLGRMHRGLFATIMFVTSALWGLGFIAIGFVFGKSSQVFGSYALILLVVAIIVVTLFYRYLQSDEITNDLEDVRS